MSDSTHNALVTVMIIIAVIIAIILLGRGLTNGALYRYQQASAINVYQIDKTQPSYSSVVTAYSRPSRPTNFGSSHSSTTTQYQYETTYVCPMDAMRCADGSYVGRSGPSCQFYCPAH